MTDQPPAQAAEPDFAKAQEWCERQFKLPNYMRTKEWDNVAAAYLALQRQKEAAERNLATWGIIEIAVRNINVKSYMEHWEGRTEKAEAALTASRAQARAAVEALRPFVEFADAVDARYRKRGGKPESFPDTHPFADIRADQLKCGVWRRARECLAAPSKEKP